MKPTDHPDFKRLLKIWDEKLRASGFIDIEQTKNGTRVLKKSGTHSRFERSHVIVREAQANYYVLLHDKIQITQFKDEIDREILLLHADGMKQCEMKKKLSVKLSRSTIYKKLYKYLREWGLK